MDISYKNTITVDEVNVIRKSMGWRQQHPDQLQELLDEVDLIIAAYVKNTAVGVAIGQGYILIMPEYQYQGIENEFMKRIIAHTRSKLKPGYGTQIDIRAFGDKQIALYENLGFQISTAEQRGVPMHICVTDQIELTDKMFKQMEFTEDCPQSNKKIIRIETNRLILRNYEESDLQEYFKLFSDKKNMYYLNDITTDTIDEARISLKNAIEVNESGKARRFCITLKNDGRLIGGVGYEIATITPLGMIADPMGWFIMPEFQNKGYVTEAAKKVLEFAFLQDNCIRIVTGCYKNNLPTQKIMEKVGFRKESERIKAQYHDGEMKDKFEYAINKDDAICLLNKWQILN